MIRVVAKRDAKKEKRARNDAYATKFRRRQGRKQRKTKEQLNQCNVPGHPETCTFDTCPDTKFQYV
jgi:hypothetical protein